MIPSNSTYFFEVEFVSFEFKIAVSIDFIVNPKQEHLKEENKGYCLRENYHLIYIYYCFMKIMFSEIKRNCVLYLQK